MKTPGGTGLAGELIVSPGPDGPTLRSSRPELAPRLAFGQPAAALPSLLGTVFTLCGGAHRLAASAAVTAAANAPQLATDAERDMLRGDTLREHLRRIFLDWPRAMPWPTTAPDVTVLASCPLWRDPLAWEASRGWIEQHVLGEPAAAWAAAWQRAPQDQARRWGDDATTAPARWWRAAATWLAGLERLPRPLKVHDSVGDLSVLARCLAEGRLDADAGSGFVGRPIWQGQPAETGPWARLADEPRLTEACASPAMRLAARVAEVALLLQPEGHRRLAIGAWTPDRHEGLAYCEMARGLLVHWVRLAPATDAGGPRVAACRVLAPTDWNFHPGGAMARLLAELPIDAPAQQLQLLAAAFDPCVSVRIEKRVAAAEISCTR